MGSEMCIRDSTHTHTQSEHCYTLIFLCSVCGVTKQINGTGSVNIAVPEHHSLSYDCRVTLKAVKNDSSLLLNITSLHLTSGGDRVQIIDGPSLGNRVLAQLTEASPGEFCCLSLAHRGITKWNYYFSLAHRGITRWICYVSLVHQGIIK